MANPNSIFLHSIFFPETISSRCLLRLRQGIPAGKFVQWTSMERVDTFSGSPSVNVSTRMDRHGETAGSLFYLTNIVYRDPPLFRRECGWWAEGAAFIR
jgi:hypothetical protein